MFQTDFNTNGGHFVLFAGYADDIKWSSAGTSGIVIHTPVIPANKMPCDYAWVFKLQNLAA